MMSLKTWEKRIGEFESGMPIPESLITAYLSACNKWGADDGTRQRLIYLGDSDGAGLHWNIAEKQTAKGIKWLRANQRKLGLSPYCEAVLNNFQRFEFAGVYWVCSAYGRVIYARVYRVIATDGESFRYIAQHRRQQGGGLEILR